MDSSAADSDGDVVISDSSFSEGNITDFSEEVLHSKAHSTLRASSLHELIDESESDKEDRDQTAYVVESSSEADEKGETRASSLHELIDESESDKEDRDQTAYVVESSSEADEKGETHVSIDENSFVEEEKSKGKKGIMIDDDDDDDDSIVKVNNLPGKRRVFRIESSDEDDDDDVSKNRYNGDVSSKSEMSVTKSVQRDDLKTVSVVANSAAAPAFQVAVESGISSAKKMLPDPKGRNIDLKSEEDSLDNVTVIDTSDIQDYAANTTRICKLQNSVVKSQVGKRPQSSGAWRVSNQITDENESKSSSDEEPYSDAEEEENEEVQVITKQAPCEENLSEKLANKLHVGSEFSGKLPKETGGMWVKPQFQSAGNLFRTEQEVKPSPGEKAPSETKEVKNEIIKPEVKRLLPTEKQLRREIESLEKDVLKLKMMLMSVDVSKLPDQGMRLRMKFKESEKMLKEKQKALADKAFVEDDEVVERKVVKPPVPHRLPAGFGMQALQTQIREKTVTDEALQRLHGSINSCPAENVFADPPRNLRSSVQLMPHQLHALAWLMWRETQKPPSGILADDMGLGKTLTMISLALKCKEDGIDDKGNDDEEEEEDEEDDSNDANWLSRGKRKRPQGGTLVVCPASLIGQWETEIKKHCRRDVLDVELHHGAKREDIPSRLARNDIVITTYSIVRISGGKADRGVLHQIIWQRIILDEAHVVRNHKSQQSVAVCSLRGKKRWALTGTPVHNKELDLYALMKFLRITPFDDYNVWHRWVDSKNAAGLKRLNTVIQAIMLRRTKEMLQTKGELQSLPEKKIEEFTIRLDEEESKVYHTVLVFSKTLFAQFLAQRAEKENLMSGNVFNPSSGRNRGFQVDEKILQKHPELAHMFRKMSHMKDIKTHQILVLLLRLRQICCHAGLIKAMLDDEIKETDGIEDEEGLDIDILEQFRGMSLKESASGGSSSEGSEEQINVLTASNPVFDMNRISSKMKKVFEVLEEKVLKTSDKAVIVSQWTSMLNIVHDHLKEKGVRCQMLTGAVKVADRMDVVNEFNKEGRGFQVLLLSLTAGGVGLNLIGGNHLFMIDLHWNPQLECQAFDRVYRVGQKKNVFVYKFVCEETIEQRIRALQESKLALAANVLSGSLKRGSSKLTLQDLRTLFSM